MYTDSLWALKIHRFSVRETWCGPRKLDVCIHSSSSPSSSSSHSSLITFHSSVVSNAPCPSPSPIKSNVKVTPPPSFMAFTIRRKASVATGSCCPLPNVIVELSTKCKRQQFGANVFTKKGYIQWWIYCIKFTYGIFYIHHGYVNWHSKLNSFFHTEVTSAHRDHFILIEVSTSKM